MSRLPRIAVALIELMIKDRVTREGLLGDLEERYSRPSFGGPWRRRMKLWQETYEPFGIMFGMIGSMYLFVLTVLVLLTSLAVRRPWCQTLCPVNAMTDYIKFNKMWVKQSWNKSKKSKKRKLARQQGGAA